MIFYYKYNYLQIYTKHYFITNGRTARKQCAGTIGQQLFIRQAMTQNCTKIIT